MTQIPEHGNIDGGMLPPSGSPPAPPTSPSPGTSAIVAFVLGILAFITCGPCTGVPALIVGLIELRNIKKNVSPAEGKPFALAGAILGGINTAFLILGLLIYIAIFLFIFMAPGVMD